MADFAKVDQRIPHRLEIFKGNIKSITIDCSCKLCNTSLKYLGLDKYTVNTLSVRKNLCIWLLSQSFTCFFCLQLETPQHVVSIVIVIHISMRTDILGATSLFFHFSLTHSHRLNNAQFTLIYLPFVPMLGY